MFLLSHKHFSKKMKMWAVAFCHVECCSLLVQHKETLVLLLEIEIRILDYTRRRSEGLPRKIGVVGLLPRTVV
jgi:hypothetical protein